MREILIDFLVWTSDFFSIKNTWVKLLFEPTGPKVYNTSLKTIESGYFNFTLKGLILKLWYNTKPLFVSEIPKTYLTPDNYNKTMKLFNSVTFKKDMSWLENTFDKNIKTLDNFVKSNPEYLTNRKDYTLLSNQSKKMYDFYNKEIENLKLNDKNYGVIYKNKKK